MLRESGGAPHEHSSVVAFEACVSGIEQLSSRNHDEVETAARLKIEILPEDLSNQAFRAIPPDRVTQLSRRDDAEPGAARLSRRHQQGEKPSPHALSRVEHLLEFCPFPEPPALAELPGRHGRRHEA
jgi:hypothetical protein